MTEIPELGRSCPRRVALVHDWLTGMRGGERALEAICDLFPDATRFALLHVPGSVSKTIEARPIHTSFIQWFPKSHRYYRMLLPLFPAAVEQFDLDEFDLIVTYNGRSFDLPLVEIPEEVFYVARRRVFEEFDADFAEGRRERNHQRLGVQLRAPAGGFIHRQDARGLHCD